MAENVLQAKITADISDLESKLKKADKIQSDYAKSVSDTRNAISENNKISREYKKAIKELTTAHEKSYISTTQYNKALEKLNKDSKETQIDTINLTKRLKDLQSGTDSTKGKIESSARAMSSTATTASQLGKSIGHVATFSDGAASSITTLITRFVSLQGTTGGTSTAISALVGSLSGPAGIALAISALVPLIGKYISNQKDAKRITEEFNVELEKYEKSLQGVNASRIKGAKDAASELATLELLNAQVNNNSLSNEKRKEAINRLRELYPSYLAKMTDEKILAGGLTTIYYQLRDAILAKAKAQAASEAIVDNARKELVLNSQIESVNKKLSEQKERQQKAQDATSLKAKNNYSQQQGALLNLANQTSKTNQLEEKRNNLLAQRLNLQLDSMKLAEEVGKEGGIVPLDFKEVELTKGSKDKIKNALQEQAKLDKLTFEVEGFKISEKVQEDANNVVQIYEDSGARIAKALKPDEVDLFPGVEESFQNIVAFEAEVKKLQALLGQGFDGSGYTLSQLQALEEKFKANAQAAKVFGDGVSAGLGAFAQSITDSLETGNKVLDAFVGAVISSLAQVLSATIANNTSMLAAKSSSTTASIALDTAKATGSAIAGGAESGSATGPGAIAAIPLMIAALVAVVGAAFSSIKFAHGGIVPGGNYSGDRIPAMLNSGEMVANSRQQSNLLMAIANGNSSRMQSGQPSGGLEFTTAVRGSDLLLTLKRAEKNNNRFSV